MGPSHSAANVSKDSKQDGEARQDRGAPKAGDCTHTPSGTRRPALASAQFSSNPSSAPQTNPLSSSSNLCECLQIGDPAVGKTALTQMFHSNGQRFPKAYNMTCGVDFCVKAVTVPGTTDAVEFHCFDVGGQDIFSEMFGSYCEGTKAVLLVYDVTRGHTFEACGNWYSRLLEATGAEGLPGAVVANKVDLRERIVINRQVGQRMAASMNMPYFETSALDGHACDEPFVELAKAFAGGADQP